MISDVVRYQPPPVWGVLCIDCWDNNGSDDMFYRRMISELKKYNIFAVVNCATNLKIDYRDRSVYNTLRNYLWSPDPANPRLNDIILLDLIHCAGDQPISQVLNDHLFDHNTVHLSRKESFLHHGHCYWSNVQDWIVIGSAWKYCLHTGPLGFDKLIDINNHKFHIFPEWGIQDEHGQKIKDIDLMDDYYVWAPIEGNGYRLITRADNDKWITTT